MMPDGGADERLVVMLEARIKDFERNMQAAERRGTRTYEGLRNKSKSATRDLEMDMARSTSRINSALASVSGQIGSFGKAFAGGLAVGAITAALANLSRSVVATVKDIATIGDQASRTGLGVEAFQELAYVAQQSRIPVDALTDGMKELNLRADEFVVTGGGPAAEAFRRLGYSAEELKVALKDPSALLQDVIGRLESLDKAAQIRITDELFGGTAGERFVELIGQGEEGIKRQVERARELGLVLDDSAIRAAQELDAKFAEIADRIGVMWQRSVVGAAEFFGVIEDEGEAYRQKIEYLTESVTSDVQNTIRALAAEIPTLLDAGADETALALDAVVTEMDRLSGAFASGAMESDDFRAAMAEATTQAVDLLTQANGVNGVDLSSAIASVGGLSSALETAFGWAQSLASALPGAPVLQDGTSAGMEAEARRRPVFTPTGGPSVRPQRPGVDSFGTVGGGRGGGSGRVEALLSDLATEREIMERWYSESLALVNEATDAQLEALGGRHEALERLETEHAQRMAEIKRDEAAMVSAAASGLYDELGGLLTTFGQQSRAAAIAGIALNKALRIGEIVQNTAAAQVRALAELGPIAGAAAAAKIGLYGKLQAGIVAATGLAQATGGGGGSVGNLRGTRGTQETASDTGTTQASQKPIAVTVRGIGPNDILTGQMVRDMFEAWQKEAKNRGMTFTFV